MSWLRKAFGGSSQKSAKSQADKMILQQLKSLGADMGKQREVIHYLYLPTREASQASAEGLRLKGYLVEEKKAASAKPDSPNPFLVLAK